MKIVIDGRLWSESGIGRYLRNLVGQLQQIDRDNEYFILHLKKDFETVNYPENFQKVLADFKWYGIGEQVRLLRLLKELKPDLVHFPHFNVPYFYRGKYVLTIHDLIHQHHQTRETTTLNPLFHTVKKLGYRKVFNHAIRSAQKIITPSEFVKNQLQQECGVRGEKIVVTLEGVDEGILRAEDKVGISKPYLFYVGNAQPHKNLPRLIKALGVLREKYPDLGLVLAGPPHKFWDEIKKLHTRGVTFTGFVSEEELVALYKNAKAFVMPSLEEGFGIPVLEAMASGCPVVSSNAGSLPEVGGDAAIYFDPKSEEDMAAKISQVLENNKLREELIIKGLKRYKEFSWKKMAEQTLEVYSETNKGD